MRHHGHSGNVVGLRLQQNAAKHRYAVFCRKQKCLPARAFLRRPSIVHLRETQRGEARRHAEQGFLHIFYHKQKCLLARAFLCLPSIVQLRKAQRGNARRLAEQGFLHIL